MTAIPSGRTPAETRERQKMSDALLRVESLARRFPGGHGSAPLTVFAQVNFTVRRGEFVCMIGHSGCGKSTILGIARAFAIQPKLLLMDEPFGALDALTRGTIQEELVRIWEQSGQTVFMITRDVDEAILLADRIILMTNGPDAGIAEIVEVTLARPRERAPDPRARVLRDPQPSGRVPGEALTDAARAPAGCLRPEASARSASGARRRRTRRRRGRRPHRIPSLRTKEEVT